MSDKMSSRISSVSNSSKFSIKSQQVIAAQDETISKQDDKILKMRKMLVEAGIDPDSVLPAAATDENVGMDLDQARGAKTLALFWRASF